MITVHLLTESKAVFHKIMTRNRFISWFNFVFPQPCFILKRSCGNPTSFNSKFQWESSEFFFFLEQTISIILQTHKWRWSLRVIAFFFTDWHWWMRTVIVVEASLSKTSPLSTLSFILNFYHGTIHGMEVVKIVTGRHSYEWDLKGVSHWKTRWR